jgi:glyoxylase-like metal-dependent hydrolase (beta-lactamase superfamily II)
MSAAVPLPRPLHELGPGLALARGGPGRSLNVYLLGDVVLAPVAAHPVSRTLGEADLLGGFEVLEVPGHSPGALALWREGDRVLVCGDVVANFGLHPSRPRLVLAPAALSSDYQQNRRSAARLAELRPRLACCGHGFAVTDPGRFAAALDQLGPTSS